MLETRITVDIYSAKGELVKRLAQKKFASGTHEMRWNGLNENGKRVAAGVYHVSFRAENRTLIGKMTTIY